MKHLGETSMETENKYYQDIFYSTTKLDFQTKIAIINDAKTLAVNWWVDKLDCNISFARQTIEMSFEDIMEKFNTCEYSKKKHYGFFKVIHRRGYGNWKKSSIYWWRGEIVMGYSCGPEYFLWINIIEPDLEKLIKKYSLKAINEKGIKDEFKT